MQLCSDLPEHREWVHVNGYMYCDDLHSYKLPMLSNRNNVPRRDFLGDASDDVRLCLKSQVASQELGNIPTHVAVCIIPAARHALLSVLSSI